MTRTDGRKPDALRPLRLTADYTKYAEGSVLIEMGGTKVLCTATVEDGVPSFMRGAGRGWVTAEYSMLPRATQTRNQRDIARLKLSPRSSEIQRLIGRALRSVTDLTLLGERSVIVDCDVLQADGGTRTASITGGFAALVLALKKLQRQGTLQRMPVKNYLAAVSVGLLGPSPLLDLCYEEDSSADADMNVVMDELGNFTELQGTGEKRTFSRKELSALLALAEKGIKKLIAAQRRCCGELTELNPPPKKLVLASGNAGKLRELRELTAPIGFDVISMAEAGMTEEIPETGTTFEENALIKARAVAKFTGLPAVADDSGLSVDALNGEPGVYSARYAGEGADDGDRIAKLLSNMQGVPDDKRQAHFVSAVAYCEPGGKTFTVRGECHGTILREPRGDGGFGYDPVFFVPELGETFGELTAQVKNTVSHRARAMELFCEKMKKETGK